jgi:hypothetical protein
MMRIMSQNLKAPLEKRCEDAPHSQGTSCEISLRLAAFREAFGVRHVFVSLSKGASQVALMVGIFSWQGLNLHGKHGREIAHDWLPVVAAVGGCVNLSTRRPEVNAAGIERID